MSLVKIENQSLEEVIGSKRVLVDFYAEWCGPCKMLAPILEELSSEGVEIVKVDVDARSDLAQQYGVTNMPTLMLFENGKVINKQIGFMPKVKIQEFIK